MPRTGPQGQVGGRHRGRRPCRRPSSPPRRGRGGPQAAGGRGRGRPAGPRRARRAGPTPGVRAGRAAPSRGPRARGRSRPPVEGRGACAGPPLLEQQGDGRRGVGLQRVAPAEVVEGGVEGPAGRGLDGARGRSRGTAPAPSPSISGRPEVEQPPGDDVALDLRGPAVDGRRPRVEELRPPPAAHRVVTHGHLGGQASATRSNTACSVVASRTLSIEVSGPSRSPAARRRCVDRERARKA